MLILSIPKGSHIVDLGTHYKITTLSNTSRHFKHFKNSSDPIRL